jgi:hypothetical protein
LYNKHIKKFTRLQRKAKMFDIQTLPLTGETAVMGYEAHVIGFRNGRETVAFDGLLKRGEILTAVIKNDGMGGETMIDFVNGQEEELFKEYVAKWTFGWSVNGLQNMAHTIETVVDTLAYETMTRESRSSRKVS